MIGIILISRQLRFVNEPKQPMRFVFAVLCKSVVTGEAVVKVLAVIHVFLCFSFPTIETKRFLCLEVYRFPPQWRFRKV